MSDLDALLARVEAATGPDNALDIAIEIALFEPDEAYASVRPNAAGTKLIYTTHGGENDTFLAADYTLNDGTRRQAANALRALSTIRSTHP